MYIAIFILKGIHYPNLCIILKHKNKKFLKIFPLDEMIHHYRIKIAFVSVTQLTWVKNNSWWRSENDSRFLTRPEAGFKKLPSLLPFNITNLFTDSIKTQNS